MGVLDSLNKAKANWAGDSTVKMNLGDGNTKVDIEAGSAEMLFGFCDHDIDVVTTCGDADIATMCGDNTIDISSAGNATVKTGYCGEDVVNITADKNAVAITGDSDDTVDVRANGFVYVDTASKDKVSKLTDNDTVSVIAGGNEEYLCSYKKLMCNKFGISVDTEDKPNYVNLGNGDDVADIIANNVRVNKSAGTLLLGALGSNYSINSKADKNTIGAYGDSYEYNLRGGADNDVRTMDFWIRDGEDGKKIAMNDGSYEALKDLVDDVDGVEDYTLTQYDSENNAKAVSFFKEKFATYFDNMTNYEEEEGKLLDSKTEELSGMTVEEIAEAYGLSCADAASLLEIDRSAMYDENTPKYALVETEKTGCDCCSDTKYVLVELTSVSDEKVIAKTVNGGETVELTLKDVECGCGSCCCDCEKETASHIQDFDLEGQQQTTDTYELFKNWTTQGIKNWEINLKKASEIEVPEADDCSCKCPCEEQEGQEEETEVLGKGKLMANISARSGYVIIDGKEVNYDDNVVDINVIGSHTDTEKTTTEKQSSLDWALAIFNKKQQETCCEEEEVIEEEREHQCGGCE